MTVAQNAGVIETNMNTVGGLTGIFINAAKAAQSISIIGGGVNFPTFLNDDGYITSAPPANISMSVHASPSNYTGNFVVKWAGTQKFRLNPSVGLATQATIISGNSFVTSTNFTIELSGADGSVEFKPNGFDGAFNMQMITGNTGSNLRIYRKDHEDAFNNGATFTPELFTKMRQINYGTLRFLDWFVGNSTNVYEYSQLPSTTALSYANPVWRAAWQVGDISGTTTKTSAGYPSMPVNWTNGEVFQGFNLSASAGVSTFAPGARTAKTIQDEATNTGGSFAANSLQTLYYNGDIDRVTVVYAGATGGFGSCSVPLSVIVTLCNQLRTNCWINFPPQGSDDCFFQIAKYIHDNLDPGLKLYAQLSNELWNPSFPQTSLYNYCGKNILGLPEGSDEARLTWYAKRHLAMAAQIENAFGNDMGRLVRILGIQLSTNYVFTYEPYLFKGQALVPAPSAPNRPIDHADAITGADYVAGVNIHQLSGDYSSIDSGLLTAADNYATGTPALMTSALNYVDADLKNVAGTPTNLFGTLSELNTSWTRWNTVCTTYSKDLIMYEGGFAISGPNIAKCTTLGIDTAYASKIFNLISAYKYGDYGAAFYTTRFTDFFGYSQAKSSSQYSTWLADSSSEGSYPWSIVIGGFETTPRGGWDTIVTYNGQRSLRPERYRGASVAAILAAL